MTYVGGARPPDPHWQSSAVRGAGPLRAGGADRMESSSIDPDALDEQVDGASAGM